MTFSGGFGRVFRPVFDPGLAAPWWLSGGVATANCVAVYQPIRAASLAASYVNLANPGTYDAAPGVAPTFDAATGWTFNGMTQYLTTGLVPGSVTWSMLARVSNVAWHPSGTTYYGAVIGAYSTPGDHRFTIYPYDNTKVHIIFGNDGILDSGSFLTAAVFGFAGQYGYVNGVAVSGSITPFVTPSAKALLIGAHTNYFGDVGYKFYGKIQAVVIYNTTLTAPQVASISAAMAAL